MIRVMMEAFKVALDERFSTAEMGRMVEALDAASKEIKEMMEAGELMDEEDGRQSIDKTHRLLGSFSAPKYSVSKLHGFKSRGMVCKQSTFA